ncbi:ABC transporter ATP-binding protein [Hathewaya histolytica]|uniref:ABC transporter ATP-binding protein n=1 Tax=Hathewaya histolytica TaxID=1498 RepID=A0A4U9RQ70_HATHI|nr:ABC transporter ATP-binding protein [Hathewaya histolytica]VTQ94365.1 ABC transporter ATP-binding protein [Hathewaya histolytica]
MNVLEVSGLKKKLGKELIIKGIDFSVKEGEVFGFLGPNGAGKTTTIRMIVGLIHNDSGSIKIMGHDLKNEREKALSNVGAVVENPELYGYLSGRENLMQIARIRGVKRREVNRLIELVGLKDKIDVNVKKYSLGMKQRLGLAAALISDPKLLILDEPTNGLDPTGILDFRKIVKTAAKERGVSVFISSHILSEVQQLCDRVAFIKDGLIQSIESVNNEEDESIITVIRSLDNEHCIKVLNEIDKIAEIVEREDCIEIKTSKEDIPVIIKNLIHRGVLLEEFYIKHKGLEQRYLELVKGGAK